MLTKYFVIASLLLSLLTTQVDAQGRASKSEIYFGPQASISLIGQAFAGGYKDSPTLQQSIPSKLGNGYGGIIGFRFPRKNLVLDFGFKFHKSFTQEYETRSTFVNNNGGYANSISAWLIAFEPSLGLRQDFSRKTALNIALGPSVGLVGIYTQEEVVQVNDRILEGSFWDIKGGYMYGAHAKVYVGLDLSRKLRLDVGLNTNYVIYKPDRKSATKFYQSGSEVPLNEIPRSMSELDYVEDPTSVSFSTEDPQPITQQYFNLSNLALFTILTFSL
jgi:hypothetical protein